MVRALHALALNLDSVTGHAFSLSPMKPPVPYVLYPNECAVARLSLSSISLAIMVIFSCMEPLALNSSHIWRQRVSGSEWTAA